MKLATTTVQGVKHNGSHTSIVSYRLLGYYVLNAGLSGVCKLVVTGVWGPK